MKAPHFNLPDQNGQMHSLEDYKGKWLIVYFYPKDDTPGCTTEACSFRDNLHLFKDRGIEVVGISKDTQASHKKFAEKYKLPFTLLSDTTTKVIDAFGAWGEKKMYGRSYMGILRNTYIIAPEGNLVKSFEHVQPATHIKQILDEMNLLMKASK